MRYCLHNRDCQLREVVPTLKSKLFTVSTIISDLGNIIKQTAPGIDSRPALVEDYYHDIALNIGKLLRIGNFYKPDTPKKN